MENIITLGVYPGNEVRCVFSLSLPRSPKDLLSEDTAQSESDNSPVEAPPPSLTDGSNSSPPQPRKPGYGGTPARTRFGLRARRRIIRAGACLDEFVPGMDVLFLTGTLPGGTTAAMQAIADWSSWLVLELKKWIFKREKAADSLYCWEYQKRGALHLHYAVRIASEAARAFIQANFKRWWYGAMTRVSERAGVDVFGRRQGGSWRDCPDKIQADAQVVTKSVGRYLAKYLAKSATGHASTMLPTPVRWFGVSRSLSKRVANQTYEVLLRFSDVRRFRETREQVYSLLQAAEGIHWSYRDKYGFAEVLGLYPVSPAEYQCVRKELEVMSEKMERAVVQVRANVAELRRYWGQVRIAFPAMPMFCEKSSPSRYAYLMRVLREDGMRSLDFVVLTRWIMTCLAACAHSGAFKRIAAADARISEYLLRVVAIAGDPLDYWHLVADELKVPVVGRVHKRATIRYKQYAGPSAADRSTDVASQKSG